MITMGVRRKHNDREGKKEGKERDQAVEKDRKKRVNIL